MMPGDNLGHWRGIGHVSAVRLTLRLICASLLCLRASAAAFHTQARLALALDTARPGETVLAGIVLRMDPQWHTYWKNPGAAGMATSIAWQLPPGIRAGAIEWPVPDKTGEKELTTYTYENEVVLLVPLELAADMPAGQVELKATVSWLECQQTCVPGSAPVSAMLKIGSEQKPSSDAALLAQSQKLLPQPGASIAAQAAWAGTPADSLRPVVLQWKTPGVVTDPDFYPDASASFEVQAETQKLDAPPGQARIRKTVQIYTNVWPSRLSGVVVEKTSDNRRLAFNVDVPVTASENGMAAPEAIPAGSPASGVPPPSLLAMLFSALLGGLILNIMPCVLPVIALKILGFVAQAKEDPRSVRRLGMIYSLGVLVSFLALAAVAIVVQASGRNAAWGMQFGNPRFLVIMTVLVTLIALNLFGLFEASPGGRLLDAAGELSSRHGAAGAFFNGLLAVVLGTSCTAPFLVYALGFAFTQPPAIILLVFAFVALGMALPYLLLSFRPAWLKFLPRPGRWMGQFKVAMGFPMLATAVWLFSLAVAHYGKRALWLGLFLVLVSMAAWVYGEFVQRATRGRAVGLAAALALLVGGYFYVLEGQLRWRFPEAPQAAGNSLKEADDGIEWQPWNQQAVEAARREGRPVLVDFTADWCLNCLANKRIALEVPSVRARLKQLNVLALIADYTNTPDSITTELRHYGRAGVPLVLVFPKEPSRPAIVLPALLTPGIVLNALDKAGE